MNNETKARLIAARRMNATNRREPNCFRLFQTIAEFNRSGLALSGIATKNDAEQNYLFFVLFGD